MKISRSALLPYSAKNMYDVVADIPSYPAFLGWCEDAHVIDNSILSSDSVPVESADASSHRDFYDTEHEVVAKLIIAYATLDFSFTTRNVMRVNESIKMHLEDGPFSDLQGEWRFTALSDDACKVSLDMDFMFDNPVAHKVLSAMFEKIITAQLDAFQKRAKRLYGVTG